MSTEQKVCRAWQAYQLLCEVLDNYGPEYAAFLTPMEEMVNDDKTINIINYLNI